MFDREASFPKLRMLLNTKIDLFTRDDFSEVYIISFIRDGGIKNHYICMNHKTLISDVKN